MKDLNDLFQNTIKDIYSSEKLILKALPDMAQAAQNQSLRGAIQQHISQTQEHVARIEQVAQQLGFDPSGVTCQATVGLLKEATEHLEEFGGSPAGDAAIIACAQKVEHYEIANYGTVVTWAEMLGYENVIPLLEQTLQEEEETDDTLSEIAEGEVNAQAQTGGDGRAQAL
ncbi:MAG: ferritin-like domain-containing protein [Fimbriimonas sp.]